MEQGHRERIEGLPWGSGSGMAVRGGGARPGYVFCVQVGDRPQPLFRCVEYGAGERDSGGVDRAGDRRGREDAGGRGRSGDAGEPAAPSASRSAAGGRRPAVPPTGGTHLRRDRPDHRRHLCPYPERIIRTFRAAMGGTDDPAPQAANVLGVVRNLGLEPYKPPPPLPEITPDDVHLVCWLALV